MGAVVGLLVVAFAACLFVMWVIAFRLRSHLVSIGYRFIFAGKACSVLLCGAGIYLIIWPLKHRNVMIQLVWFTLLAASYILAAIGFYLYSRDVNSVLASDMYPHPLPAQPPVVDNTIHITDTRM